MHSRLSLIVYVQFGSLGLLSLAELVYELWNSVLETGFIYIVQELVELHNCALFGRPLRIKLHEDLEIQERQKFVQCAL